MREVHIITPEEKDKFHSKKTKKERGTVLPPGETMRSVWMTPLVSVPVLHK